VRDLANLLLSRATDRDGKFAVGGGAIKARTVLGRDAVRIIRQLRRKTAFLGLLGAASYSAPPTGLPKVLASKGARASLPRLDQVASRLRVLLIHRGVALLPHRPAGSCAGYPPLEKQLSDDSLKEGLREAAVWRSRVCAGF